VESQGFDYRRLDGSTPSEQRTHLVNEFNNDEGIFIFLISTKAGGLGLNITGANTVVVFDPTWNPSHDSQAQDRAYRIGQSRDVKVYRLITAGSLEENIYLRQVYKQQLSRNAVDGEKARRYFTAINGQKKGELFGVKNLFQVRDASIRDACLTSKILDRQRKQEDRVHRGGSNTRLRLDDLDLEENCLNYDLMQDNNSNSPRRPDPEDSMGLGDVVFQEGGGMRSVLRSSRIIHSHANQGLIGGSRAEEHISAHAQRVVADGDVEDGDAPAIEGCSMIAATQAVPTEEAGNDDDDPEEEEEEEKTPTDYFLTPLTEICDLPMSIRRKQGIPLSQEVEEDNGSAQVHLRGNEARTVETSQVKLLYGQTPEALQAKDFAAIAQSRGISEVELAREIMEASNLEIARMLKVSLWSS